MTVRELQTRIARATNGHAPIFELPSGAVRAIGRGLEAFASARGRTAALSEEMAIQSTLRVVVSSAKASRELGYRCRPATESIRDAVTWYRERGWL